MKMPQSGAILRPRLAAARHRALFATRYVNMSKQVTGKSEHLQILRAPEEAAALEAFRLRNQRPTRLSAMHEVLKRGLGLAPPKRNAMRAKDFAITRPMTKVRPRP